MNAPPAPDPALAKPTPQWNGIDATFLARLPKAAPLASGRRGASHAPELPKPAPRMEAATLLTACREIRRPGRTPRGVMVATDAQHRVAVTKLTTLLNWATETPLTARLEADRVVLTMGQASAEQPGLIDCRLDSDGRLTLTPAIREGLGIGSREQALVIADTRRGELTIFSAADVLAALLTGVHPEVHPATQRESKPEPAKGRIKKPRF